MREAANFERFARHGTKKRSRKDLPSRYETRYIPINHIRVSNHSSQFRIAISPLRPFIDVGATNDSQPVIHNADLCVDVHLFSGQDAPTQLCPITKREDRDVIRRLERELIPENKFNDFTPLTSIPSFLNLPNIEFGPLQIVLF